MTLLILVLAIAPQALVQGDRIETALAGFASEDWQVRAHNLKELKQQIAEDESLLRDTRIRDGIVGLLERENALIAERYAAGLSSEDLSDYYFSSLLPLCDHLLQEFGPEPRLLGALLRGSYNPDSEMVKVYASYGPAVVDIAVELTQSRNVIKRWNGYAILGRIVEFQRAGKLRSPLSATLTETLKSVLRQGLQDPDPSGLYRLKYY